MHTHTYTERAESNNFDTNALKISLINTKPSYAENLAKNWQVTFRKIQMKDMAHFLRENSRLNVTKLPSPVKESI